MTPQKTIPPLRLPNDTQRHAIVGRTGSGKTYAAVWHLSQRDFDKKPWIIYDFKGDDLIGALPAREISLSDTPDEPGLYVVRPLPDQVDEMNEHLYKIWAHENTGLYVDEAYMIGQRTPGYRAILTQGRSKHIPLITLSQRPLWVDTFTFSEADFIQIFALNHFKDRRTVEQFAPVNLDDELPEHTSWYYDVGRNQVYKFHPVPPAEEIIAIFRKRFEVAEQQGEPIPTPSGPALTRI